MLSAHHPCKAKIRKKKLSELSVRNIEAESRINWLYTEHSMPVLSSVADFADMMLQLAVLYTHDHLDKKLSYQV